eukprot:2181353-Prymnesium_polylepis.1
MCKYCAKRGVRAAGRGRGRIIWRLGVRAGPLRCRGGAYTMYVRISRNEPLSFNMYRHTRRRHASLFCGERTYLLRGGRKSRSRLFAETVSVTHAYSVPPVSRPKH